jgi:hypothetical protein
MHAIPTAYPIRHKNNETVKAKKPREEYIEKGSVVRQIVEVPTKDNVRRGGGRERRRSLCGGAGALLLDVLEKGIEESTDLWVK